MAKKKTKKLNKKKIAIFSIIAIIFAFLIILFISINSSYFHTTKTKLSGIDVSQHNGTIDWDKVAESEDFAIIRVGTRGYSTGKIKADTKADQNLKNASETNLPVGLYFYTQAINEKEAKEEADFCIKYAKKYKTKLPIFIDYEYAYDANGKETGRLYKSITNTKEAANIINAFCKEIKENGYTPGVYASSYILEDCISTNKLKSYILIWVADYNKEISYTGKYDIWQYSKNGKCNGVYSKKVDMDYWYQE